jgi:type II secretory pathway pseudopilin PulG
MKLKRHIRGISLIEVVIAFAVTALLVGATLPDVRDDAVRARVAEGLRAAEASRQVLIDACRADARALIQRDEGAAFESAQAPLDHDLIDRVHLAADCARRDLRIVVWTARTGASPDPVLEFTARASADNGAFTAPDHWSCRLITGDAEYVPPDCRRKDGAG